MRAKNFGKRVWDYIFLTASAIAVGLSDSSAVKADEEVVLERLRPMYTLEDELHPTPAVNQNIRTIENFSENRLLGIPQKYADWYLADLLMVLVHEQGHFDEALRWGIDPTLIINPSLFYSEGLVHYDYINENIDEINKNSTARAKMAIAGVVNTGNLAENLKRELLLGNIPPEGLRFISMLALVSELNLPYLILQDYRGTTPGGNDIGNFRRYTGEELETMAISSGIHMLVNAPYMYRLAKNAFGSVPTAPEKKDYSLSFRYDGDSYMIYFHSDLNTIVEKIPKPRFMLMHGEN